MVKEEKYLSLRLVLLTVEAELAAVEAELPVCAPAVYKNNPSGPTLSQFPPCLKTSQ